MEQTLCALCGKIEVGFSYKGKIMYFERMQHLEYEHKIVNQPSKIWMARSKKIFVKLPEQDIDEQALEIEKTGQELRESSEPDN